MYIYDSAILFLFFYITPHIHIYFKIINTLYRYESIRTILFLERVQSLQKLPLYKEAVYLMTAL